MSLTRVIKHFILTLLTALTTLINHSVAQHLTHSAHSSPYAGEQTREIKSLSARDIEQLERGGGWGLAKAAELNGVPGPKHVLEFKDELDLSSEQEADIQRLFTEMQKQAIEKGKRLIRLERELEFRFRQGLFPEDELQKRMQELGAASADLRFVHLAAHLKTPSILTVDQLNRYNQLRGYTTASPCDRVPSGHDPEMWRLHNGCND